MQEEGSKTITVIRHAQSQFNLAKLNATADTEFAVQFDKQLKDAEITELGMKQCEEGAKKANELNVVLVFTSPLRRTLETTKRLFENHPNQPKIQVLPEIREIIVDAGDVPYPWTGELEKAYPNYDFSRLNKLEEKKPLWFVEVMEEPLKERINGLIDQSDPATLPSDVIIDEMMRIAPAHLESPHGVMERALKVRKFLKEQASRLRDGEKIAVVAHSDFITFLIAEEFDAEEKPLKTKHLTNCEFYEYKLE